MYIPPKFEFTDKAEIVAFMKHFSFATIVTIQQDVPVATHLPFVVKEENDDIILVSHFAKANEQWKAVESNTILVIFSEPHAYISPQNYDSEQNVPTWNYVAVHAYGKAKIVSETDKVLELLESTIDTYETAYRQQWNNLSEVYKLNMLKGIVAFNVTVTDLQAKKKLSQNKTEKEQQKIIKSLSQSSNTNEQLIAHYMMKNRG